VVAGSAAVVDVAPTLAWLAGVPPDQLTDGHGRPLDGVPRDDLVSRAGRWVVGILWDGAHCGELLRLATAGELPGVARLLERGLALDGGAVAAFPSVTLANHTSLLTGVGVGRHGILGNAYWDRALGHEVVTNAGSAWHRAGEWLRPGVRTVFELVHAADPAATTACLNEPTERGATISTMALIRASGAGDGADGLRALLPDPATSPYLSSRAHLADEYFAWCTQVDDVGLEQVLQAWETAATAPRLMWWSNAVTDAGHHAGGPRSAVATDSFRDADRRLEVFLDHLDRLGVSEDVTFLLTADHGFERSVPAGTAEWGTELRAAGIPHRDVGPGFLYLGDQAAPQP
jgi:predicted AlkP superfamily pyrophosphatase or phosphodiesterase